MGWAADEHGESAALLAIETAVRKAVVGAHRRWTAGALERDIARRKACPRPLVRTAIRRLVAEGLIEYSYIFGQSYLVLSLRRPLEVGTRFTILPHDYSGPPVQPRLPLSIASGSAFGCGRHPTTRLALLALERGWSLDRSSTGSASPAVVDIGTGSGILAIAAARLGAARVTAIDIDACARVEAKDNIARNKGIAPVIVSDTPLENLNGSFDIAIANLRLPTLMRLLAWLQNRLSPEGWVVVSGVRESEWPRLETAYGGEGFQAAWRQSEAGWAGGVFRQKIGSGSKKTP